MIDYLPVSPELNYNIDSKDTPLTHPVVYNLCIKQIIATTFALSFSVISRIFGCLSDLKKSLIHKKTI